MNFQDVFDSLPTTGWLTLIEAKLLWEQATCGEGDVLEIGTYCGRSAKLLANAIGVQKFRRLYCCDPIIEGFDGVDTPTREGMLTSIAHHVLSTRTALQVHLCCMLEEDLYSIWDKGHRLDMVYIDGNHSFEATLGAIKRWAPLAAKTALHDFGGSHPGVAQAVREYRFKERLALAGRIAVFQ
jgi:hypothetical protein